MPILKPAFYDETNTVKTNQYIETGAYLGEGITHMLDQYVTIHSIELSEKWCEYNVEKFKDNASVKLHLGDSKKVLPELLDTIQEPVTIYLDAHYSGGPTAYGEEETPLLQELEIMKKRPYDDIIIIDDCRLMGKKGTCGMGEDHPIYPTMDFDWSHITDDVITGLMKEGYVLLKNDNQEYTDGPYDQYILVKPTSKIIN